MKFWVIHAISYDENDVIFSKTPAPRAEIVGVFENEPSDELIKKIKLRYGIKLLKIKKERVDFLEGEF